MSTMSRLVSSADIGPESDGNVQGAAKSQLRHQRRSWLWKGFRRGLPVSGSPRDLRLETALRAGTKRSKKGESHEWPNAAVFYLFTKPRLRLLYRAMPYTIAKLTQHGNKSIWTTAKTHSVNSGGPWRKY